MKPVPIISAVISLDLSEEEKTIEYLIDDRLAAKGITEVVAMQIVQKGGSLVDLIILGR